MPEIDILIPHHRTLGLIRACIKSLWENTPKLRSREARITVIDNDSRDESVEWLRRCNGAEFIRLLERREGLRRSGWDAGLAYDWATLQCDGKYIVTLHSDSMLCRNTWLEHLLACVQRHAAAGAGELTLAYDGGHGSFPHCFCAIWEREKVLPCIKRGRGWGADNEGLILTIALRRLGHLINVMPKHSLKSYALHIWTGTRLITDAGDAIVEMNRPLHQPAIDRINADKSIAAYWEKRGL